MIQPYMVIKLAQDLNLIDIISNIFQLMHWLLEEGAHGDILGVFFSLEFLLLRTLPPLAEQTKLLEKSINQQKNLKILTFRLLQPSIGDAAAATEISLKPLSLRPNRSCSAILPIHTTIYLLVHLPTPNRSTFKIEPAFKDGG